MGRGLVTPQRGRKAGFRVAGLTPSGLGMAPFVRVQDQSPSVAGRAAGQEGGHRLPSP